MVDRQLNNLHYILEGHTPVVEPDLLTWARWLESADRRVALTEHELFRVSTVFLGLDHQFGRGPPLLFETMAFEKTGGRFDEDIRQQRYANWEDAELGHKATVDRMVKWAREAAMPDSWVVWSEEHGRWWKPGEWGYTDSLREAGRYSEKRAKEIEARANIVCKPGEFNEVAMPDPMPGERGARPES